MNNNETKTDFLMARISQNENNQTVDINKWAFEKIKNTDEKINILELCCGTGKQTEYLVQKFPNATISCLDISIDAISAVKNKFHSHDSRMKFFNTGIDDFFKNNEEKFDIIFCSYGLYYSRDMDYVLAKINESLNNSGRLVVMGPYGENNKQLFDILLSLKVKLPDLVISSSSTFMREKVLGFSINNCNAIQIYTTQNNIIWENVESVMNYWKNSTFYNSSIEQEFQKIVEAQINSSGKFINEKKIMLIVATKNA